MSSVKPNLLIVASYLWIGGAETIISILCKTINRNRFNVAVCCLLDLGEVGLSLREEGYDVFSLPLKGYKKTKYFTFKQLNRIIKERNIDIVHSHTTQSLIDTSICRLINPKIRVVHTFHYGNYPFYTKKYLFLEKFFSKIPDRLVSVGEGQKKKIRDTFRMKENNLVVINNGVKRVTRLSPANSATCRFSEYLLSGKIVIGSVSTLIEQKGITFLIDVMHFLINRNIPVICLIAGNGPMELELRQKVNSLGLQKDVIFLGWVKNAVEDIMPYISIFVQTSLWEAMSVVVLEAMMASKPVVVTRVGENGHIINDGYNGCIVEPRDTKGMAMAIEKLALDSLLRERLGYNARKSVEKKYDLDVMVDSYEKLYEEILARPSCFSKVDM